MLFISTIIFFITGSRLCTAGDTLLSGQTLSGNQTLVSQNGIYELGLCSDDNFVPSKNLFMGIWLANFSDAVWVANRGNPIEERLMPELSISPTGNLVLIQSQKLIWSTNLTKSEETGPTIAVLLDTGNLVLKEEGNMSRTVWQSFDHPTDTWLPGAPLGLNRLTENNLYLTSMDFSDTIIFSLELDPSTHRFIRRNLSSNTTSHVIFPQSIDIVDHGNGLVAFNDIAKKHTLIQLDTDGYIRIYHLVNDSLVSECFIPYEGWSNLCGPYSLGGGDNYPCEDHYYYCSCPYGFHPTCPEDWGYRYYRAGCTRDVSIDCQSSRSSNSADVFLPVNNIYKFPDDAQLLVLKDEAECAAACLSNCSCTAYFYKNNCSLWFGELKNTVVRSNGMNDVIIHIRLQFPAPKHSQTPKHSQWSCRLFIMLPIGVVTLLVVGLLVFWKCRVICFILNRKYVIGDQLVAYSYAETKSITRNFIHKLGEGGFGSVFRGSLSNSTMVAVKRMKSTFFEEKQFRTEVQTVGMIHHINLVKLLGFCSEGSRRMLVYEYMPNGSLDSHLFANRHNFLNWNTRYMITIGIARGLTYLHEECRDCIIHCDIKPENVLLDANFLPKISDFGMAKLLGRDFSRALTTMRGTIGYLGPEWISGLPITRKSDVYSFGMMLFEIISGKRNTEKIKNPECTYFPLYAATKINQGKSILCLLDSKLEGNANMEEVYIACKVACWCIQESETDRPSMQQVVQMLQGIVEVLMPPIPSFLQRLMDIENDSTFY